MRKDKLHSSALLGLLFRPLLLHVEESTAATIRLNLVVNSCDSEEPIQVSDFVKPSVHKLQLIAIRQASHCSQRMLQ